MNKELQLLNLLSSNKDMSQRELAKQLDVSLGTVNNMIQTFEKDKVLSMKKLTPRKVSYTLSAKGRDLQNILYVEHVSECFDTIASVRYVFKLNLNKLVDNGMKNFYVQGDTDELIRIVKMCFFEISRNTNVKYTLLNEINDIEEIINDIDLGDNMK